MRLILHILILVNLSGCASSDGLSRSECVGSGGVPYDLLSGYIGCGEKYPDSGKECRSSEECKGSCLLSWDWDPAEGKEAVGRCEDSTLPIDYGVCLPIEQKDEVAYCLEED